MFKKTLSLVLALALCMTLSVFAADKTDLGKEIIIDGDGTTIYIDMEIYDVLLPTDNAFDFTLDPQGLTGIATGGTESLKDLAGGLLVGPEDPIAFINYSAVPINLAVTYVGVTDEAIFVEDEATVAADLKNNVYLTLTASAAAIEDEEATAFDATDVDPFVVTGTAKTLNFLLEAAEYEITEAAGEYTAAIATDAFGGGNALKVGGAVNGKADWTAFTGDDAEAVKMSVTFKFVKDTTEYDETDDFEGTIFGLLNIIETEPEPEPVAGFLVGGNVVDSIPNIAFSKTGAATTVTVDFFYNGLTIKSVKSGVTTCTASNYVKGENTFTISALGTYALKSLGAGSKVIDITLSDDSVHSFTIVVGA